MSEKLDRYLNNVDHLPASPAVLVKLVDLFRQPDREVDDIVNLMRQDPSLTAEVLRHSNSAYFGHEEPIIDVFEAVTRIGFHEVYRAAVAKLGSQALQLPKNARGINVETLWRHSATVAVVAGILAGKVQEQEGLAFTAGLLHDVGKIVLASAEGPNYEALVLQAGEFGPALQEAERTQFGFGHAELGARLLAKWGLPEEISVPVQYHHRVDWDKSSARLCAVISLSNIASRASSALPGENPYGAPVAVCALRLLELDENDLAKILEDAKGHLDRVTAMFGMAGR